MKKIAILGLSLVMVFASQLCASAFNARIGQAEEGVVNIQIQADGLDFARVSIFQVIADGEGKLLDKVTLMRNKNTVTSDGSLITITRDVLIKGFHEEETHEITIHATKLPPGKYLAKFYVEHEGVNASISKVYQEVSITKSVEGQIWVSGPSSSSGW